MAGGLQPLPSDSLRDRKRYIAARLQALGYLSLASLVAEKNGYATQFAELGTHASNMAQGIYAAPACAGG